LGLQQQILTGWMPYLSPANGVKVLMAKYPSQLIVGKIGPLN